jgi:hypothetical protein
MQLGHCPPAYWADALQFAIGAKLGSAMIGRIIK